MRVCAYALCNVSMEGRDPRARYCIPAHRTAQWKLDKEYGPHAREHGRGVRSNGPLRRAKPAGLKVSYRKVLVMLTAELERLGAKNPHTRAEQILRPALSEKQQQRLDEINARAAA